MQKLLSLARKAIVDYKMIKDGDKIAVGLSGGKDSIVLLTLLANYKRFSPEKFDLIAININMGFKDLSMEEVQATKNYCAALDVPLIIEDTDIAHVIFEERKEKSPCSLCSKMRRGALNTIAIKHGCNKLALGHHADDIIETFLLSFTYESRMSTFMPMTYMDRTQMTLIRPMIYIEEKNITAIARNMNLPIIHNPCPQDKHTKRQDMKELVIYLNHKFGYCKKNMLSALFHPERNNLWDKMQDFDKLTAGQNNEE